MKCTIRYGLCALAAVVLLPQAVMAQSVSGQWAGTVTEKDVGQYTVLVEIDSGQNTGAVHFLRYPCGGSLSLNRNSGAVFTFQERLTYGNEKCLDGLQARITFQGADTAYFEEIVQGQSNVTGTLKRVRDVPRR